ncbi:hypothetical protein BD413DRAFT_549708 [Trametes elegans]|nr:hypothetical protein BD413DRAFT_549708 [Trametes elegans]
MPSVSEHPSTGIQDFGTSSGLNLKGEHAFPRSHSARPGASEKGASSEKGGVQRHRDFFFEDGNVVLQVEDVQYKLHRSLLEKHSPVFRELFTIPQPEGSTEGRSGDNPIVLSGIEAMNFTRFLWLLYPPTLGFCKVTTVDEWISVVDQADRWQMDALRDHALSQLRQMYLGPIRKILIWTRYDLPAHELVPVFMDVISRPQPLSLEEAQDLGLALFVKVSHARDLVHAEGACQCCSGKQEHRGHSVAKDLILEGIVRKVIGIQVPSSPF